MSLPKLFYSEQLNAPVLTREIGKLIPILDACLVTGFNSKSVSSISVTDNIGTATTTTDHGYNVQDTIEFTGANQSVYNAPASFRILTVPDTTSFTFAITTPNGSATGTITSKVSPLGWEKVYSGTNIAVYRSTDVEGTRRYLRVDDSVNQLAYPVMYESMTGLSSGRNPTLSTLVWTRSHDTTGSTSRTWTLIGDSKRFFWLPRYHTSASQGSTIYFFGDILSFKSNDAYHCCLTGHTSYQTTVFSSLGFAGSNEATTGNYICRGFSQLGSYILFGNRSISYASTIGFSSGRPIVNGNNNAWTLLPLYCIENNNVRGVIPGMMDVWEYTPTFLLPNKTFMKSGNTEIVAFHVGNILSNIFWNWGEWTMPNGSVSLSI